MTTKATTTKPIFYRPIERHWYRLADIIQPRWRRFADSPFGYYAGRVLRYTLIAAVWLVKATVIVGMAVLYMLLKFTLSGGKKYR